MRRATLLGRVRRLCAAAERPGSAACFRSLLATRGASMQFAIVPSAGARESEHTARRAGALLPACGLGSGLVLRFIYWEIN